MELGRIRKGEGLAALSGIVLLVSLFLPWYDDVSGWGAFSVVDLLVALLALAGIGSAAITAARATPGGPVTAIVLTTGLGIAVTALVLYRLIDQPGPNELVDVRPAAYVGLLAAFGVTAGTWLAMADERLETVDPPALPAQPRPPETAAAGSAVATGSVPDAPAPHLDSPADAQP